MSQCDELQAYITAVLSNVLLIGALGLCIDKLPAPCTQSSSKQIDFQNVFLFLMLILQSGFEMNRSRFTRE